MSRDGLSTHKFSVQVAVKHGLEAAAVLDKLQYWIDHNRANGVNLKDGRYWSYNTASAWVEQMPYFSEYAIRRILKKLCDDGILMRGNYNPSAYDRTTWYAFVDEEKWISRNANIHLAKTQNGPDENSSSLIQRTTQVTTNNDKVADASTLQSIYEAYLSKRRGGRKEALKAIERALRDMPADKLLAKVKAYAQSAEVLEKLSKGESHYLPLLATWMNKGRYDDGLTGTEESDQHNRNPLVDTSSLPRSGVMVKLTDNDI